MDRRGTAALASGSKFVMALTRSEFEYPARRGLIPACGAPFQCRNLETDLRCLR